MTDEFHHLDRNVLLDRLSQICPRRPILDALVTVRSLPYSSCLSDWESGAALAAQ